MSDSNYTGRHVSLSLSPAPGDGREAEAHAERMRQTQTRAALARPLDGPTAVSIVRELIEAFDGEPRVESPAHLYSEVVYLRNTVRRQADELGRMRAELRERGSETERRQAGELMRLQQALELARAEAIVANNTAERLRATVQELRALMGEVLS